MDLPAKRFHRNRISIYRLAHYCLDLAELMQAERVLRVVIFLNPGTRQETLRLGGDGRSYLKFRYFACDLKRLSAKDYQQSDNIIARLNLPNMNYPRQERLQINAAAQSGSFRIEQDPEKHTKYVDFIDYYADLNDQDINELRIHYLNEQSEHIGLAHLLIQEGRKGGEQEGMREGRQEGL